MRTTLIASLAAAAIAAAPLAAQGAMAPAPAAQPPTSGYRAEFLTMFASASQKYIELAEAIPADKYTWRPGPGVRSVAEVFLHVANAQYLVGTSMGWAKPAGWEMKGFETSTTDKAKIIEQLKTALEWFKAGVIAMPDSDAEHTASFFGHPMTMRGFLFAATDDNAEHLGQMIAYARMNNIVPPWTARRQAAAAAKKD